MEVVHTVATGEVVIFFHFCMMTMGLGIIEEGLGREEIRVVEVMVRAWIGQAGHLPLQVRTRPNLATTGWIFYLTATILAVAEVVAKADEDLRVIRCLGNGTLIMPIRVGLEALLEEGQD